MDIEIAKYCIYAADIDQGREHYSNLQNIWAERVTYPSGRRKRKGLESKEVPTAVIQVRNCGAFPKTIALELERRSMQGEAGETESMQLYYFLWRLSFVTTN